MRLETNALPPLHAPTTKTWEIRFKNPVLFRGKINLSCRSLYYVNFLLQQMRKIF